MNIDFQHRIIEDLNTLVFLHEVNHLRKFKKRLYFDLLIDANKKGPSEDEPFCKKKFIKYQT